MDETLNGAFSEITKAYISKLNDSKIDTSIIEDLLKDISDKVQLFINNKKDKKTEFNFKNEYTDAQIDLLKNNSYVAEYKRFQTKIAPDSTLKSLFSLPFFSLKDEREKDVVKKEDETNEPNMLSKVLSFFNKNTPPTQQGTITNTTLDEDDEVEAGRKKIIETSKEYLLDGITPQGESDLRDALRPLFEDNAKAFRAAMMGITLPSSGEKSDEDDGGILDSIGGMISGIGSASSLLVRALPLLAKVAAPLAVIAAGDFIGGKIGQFLGEQIWGEEGKEAYEKYGTGITGLLSASYDYYKQNEENKETEARGERLKQEGLERSKQSLEGTKVAQNVEAHQKATEKMTTELQKAQEHKVKMEEQLKAVEEKGFFEREWGELDNAKANVETADYQIQVIQNRIAGLQKVDPAKSKQGGDNSTKPDVDVQLKDGGIVTQPVKALVGEAGPEAVIPLKDGSTAITKTGVTNGDASSSVLPLNKFFNSDSTGINNDILNKIATNTDNTNSGLKMLSEAIFRLATVFDKKVSSLGSQPPVVINGGGGQTKEPTPASLVAANNSDPIRKIRMQFAY
jgi:hypothetical protein